MLDTDPLWTRVALFGRQSSTPRTPEDLCVRGCWRGHTYYRCTGPAMWPGSSSLPKSLPGATLGVSYIINKKNNQYNKNILINRLKT